MAGPLDCDNGSLWFLNPLCLLPQSQDQRNADAKAAIVQASGGNAIMAEGAYQRYLQDESSLAVLQQSDPLPDPFGVNGLINNISGAAKTAAVTVGVVQIAFIGIAAFALFKILSSDTAKETIREIVKVK